MKKGFVSFLLMLLSVVSLAQLQSGTQKIPVVHSKQRALIIGASNYQTLGKLNYSSSDARRFRDALTNVFKFSNDSIKFLSDTDPEAPKPTSKNILDSLDALLGDPILDKGDLFILYFSGHGIGTPNGDYLCPTDSTATDIEKTGLPVSTVIQKLVDAKLRNVLIITDACRAGEKNEFGIQLFESAKKANIAVLLGCEPGKKSYESTVLKSGVFTYFLLKSLSNPKVRTESGGLWASHIAANLSDAVYEFTQHDYGDNAQRPKSFADPTSDVMLAKFVDPEKASNLTAPDADQKMVTSPQKIADQLVVVAGDLFDKGEFNSILELSKQAFSLDSNNLFAAYYASIACSYLGRSGEHEKFCNALAASEDPYFQSLGYVMSDSRATSAENREKALLDFWEHSPKDALSAVMVWTRARTYLSPIRVSFFLRKVLPSLPTNDRTGLFLKAELANSEDKTDEALANYQAALKTTDATGMISNEIIVNSIMASMFVSGKHTELKAFMKEQFSSEHVTPLVWAASAAYLKLMGNREAAIEIVKKGIKEPGVTGDIAYLTALAMGASIGLIADDLEALMQKEPYNWKLRAIAAFAAAAKKGNTAEFQNAVNIAEQYCDDETQIAVLMYRVENAFFQDATDNLGIPAEKFAEAYDAFRLLFINLVEDFGQDSEAWEAFMEVGLQTLQAPSTLGILKAHIKDFDSGAVATQDFYKFLFQLAGSMEDEKLMEFALRHPKFDPDDRQNYQAFYTCYLVARGRMDDARTEFLKIKTVAPTCERILSALKMILGTKGKPDQKALEEFLKGSFGESEGDLLAEGISALVLADLGNNEAAKPHLHHLTQYFPTLMQAVPLRCAERYVKILREEGQNDQADQALFELLRINQVSPAIAATHFGPKPDINRYVEKIVVNTSWLSDEMFDPKNPTHKRDALIAIGNGHVEITIAVDGQVSGFVQIEDGEKLIVSGSVDTLGNLRGKAVGPKTTYDIQSKLVGKEFRKTEAFKKSNLGQMIDFVDPKGVITHWLFPDSVFNPAA